AWLKFRQEADATKVDAEDGHLLFGAATRDGEDCTVAAEHKDHIRSGEASIEVSLGARGASPDAPPLLRKCALERLHHLDRRGLGAAVDDADGLQRTTAGSVHSRSPSSGGRTRSGTIRRYSTVVYQAPGGGVTGEPHR